MALYDQTVLLNHLQDLQAKVEEMIDTVETTDYDEHGIVEIEGLDNINFNPHVYQTEDQEDQDEFDDQSFDGPDSEAYYSDDESVSETEEMGVVEATY